MKHKNFRSHGQGAKAYVWVAFVWLAFVALLLSAGCSAVGGPGDATAETLEKVLARALVDEGLGGLEVVALEKSVAVLGRVASAEQAERALAVVRRAMPEGPEGPDTSGASDVGVMGVLPVEQELADCPPGRDRELFGRLAARAYAEVAAPRVVLRVVGCRAVLLGSVSGLSQAEALRNAATAEVGEVVDRLVVD